MTETPDKLLEELDALHEKAVEGEWHTRKCLCGHPSCTDTWLSSGKFCQGSGFDPETADWIKKSHNNYPTLRQHISAQAERIEKLEAVTERLCNAADRVGVAHFDTDSWSDEVSEMSEATLAARAALKEADNGK